MLKGEEVVYMRKQKNEISQFHDEHFNMNYLQLTTNGINFIGQFTQICNIRDTDRLAFEA